MSDVVYVTVEDTVTEILNATVANPAPPVINVIGDATIAELITLVENVIPSGFVGGTFSEIEPPGWFFDNQTIVNCQTLYPTLWANTPASMHSGPDLVLPDLSDRVMLFTHGATGVLGGAMARVINSNNLPEHTHAAGTLSTGTTGGTHNHTASSDIESRGHVHYLTGTAGGWTATAAIAHSHTVSVNPGNYWQGWLYSKGSYTGTGMNMVSASADTNHEAWYHTSPGTSGASAGPTGYVTGAHQTHTHGITVNTTNSGHGHTISGSTGNNTTTNTALDTTPANVSVRAMIRI